MFIMETIKNIILSEDEFWAIYQLMDKLYKIKNDNEPFPSTLGKTLIESSTNIEIKVNDKNYKISINDILNEK